MTSPKSSVCVVLVLVLVKAVNMCSSSSSLSRSSSIACSKLLFFSLSRSSFSSKPS